MCPSSKTVCLEIAKQGALHVPGSCLLCSHQVGTVLHTIRDCPNAQDIWARFHRDEEVLDMEVVDVVQWLE